MGIQSFYNSLKQKIQGSSKMERNEQYEEKIKKPPQMQNIGEQIQLMLQSKSFESAYNTAAPFLFASLGAWPGYWLFRGMDYHVHRSHIPLPIYIRQTYYQAKVVQLFIILAGTYTVFRNNSRLRLLNTNGVVDS
ncbi:uncharacterized protein LOC108145653 [Drosophila elegans]|uniref:uncharacterized protein LOC108145653 n=1 Tax=Drosophila elegans TaxID=30023 RepID=UPI0007E7CC1F|nr:uncharacterized protein LOC108145653 [Drosophila elegans]